MLEISLPGARRAGSLRGSTKLVARRRDGKLPQRFATAAPQISGQSARRYLL
jgi:hypothetical protein